MLHKFALCAILALFFTSCNEEQKIQSLKAEGESLRAKVDSLQAVIENTQFVPVNWDIENDTVRAGDGLFQVLSRMHINQTERGKIVLAMQDSVELSAMRVGQVFYAAIDSAGSVQRFRYATNPATVHMLTKTDDGYVYSRLEKPVVRRLSIFEGSLASGSTLNGTLFKVGIPGRMVGIVSGVLQCKVAFAQAQPGDSFRILLEETFYQDSIWISGKVVYAEFNGRVVGHHEAFRYDDGDPKSSFNAHYTEKGEALIFDGLRYPLDRLHITSPFGSRIHPITGQRKTHHGIDYGGNPVGTPVYAVAEGNVTVSGYDEFSGNKIAIRHRDNSESWYMHLSTRGVSVGTHVAARQVIGRVGNTGRSTGPHLHLGFKNEKGAWMNPASKTMIAAPKLTGERLARLQKQVVEIRSQIEKTLAAPAVKANDTTEVLVRMIKL
ncbi:MULTISPECIES: M23 family metallopeptidase [unclassified Fibrobacter]|uniref:M23 family metallopeptidase n=1 Tax=unclassified Fibrobacter TaxID=2634177 RepID=UPI000D6C7938|nr:MULTISPECIES: M23 family metallopeptidase [unclassified Fibrobacter]PWJ66230.1 murein DD-endopeptidase MepM/ murein hydrolase activator NlpD [Fibrobacter sp. UWR4]PZW69434.1 murein DD-endopeptidase MepM/ murein hydrolase activator NlpD [Fibrobacter sp. UWR1]